MANKQRLQEFILAMNTHKVGVSDVLGRFWHDWDELAKRKEYLSTLLEDKKRQRASLPVGQRRAFYLREEKPLSKDLLKLKTLHKTRAGKVRLAFNQLFLAGKAKMVPYPRPDLGKEHNEARTFPEYKAWRIRRCEDDIKGIKELVDNGHDDIMTQCWLGNLLDYLEGYKQTEILERHKLDTTLRRFYQPRGELLCVGALSGDAWPGRITKSDKLNYIIQGRLFEESPGSCTTQYGGLDGNNNDTG